MNRRIVVKHPDIPIVRLLPMLTEPNCEYRLRETTLAGNTDAYIVDPDALTEYRSETGWTRPFDAEWNTYPVIHTTADIGRSMPDSASKPTDGEE